MRLNTGFHSIALAVLLLSPASLLYAQTIDAVGHYEGSVSSPAGELTLEIDLTRTANGQMAGTLTIPAISCPDPGMCTASNGPARNCGGRSMPKSCSSDTR